MHSRLLLSFLVFLLSVSPCHALRTACLNSSLADLWSLAGGSVDITVAEASERGFADESALLVDGASGRNINSELLFASRPDFIIGSADTASHVRLKDFCDSASIDMMLVNLDSFDDFLSCFRTLTEMTGRPDLFEKYGLGQKAGIDDLIRKAGQQKEHPEVLFIRAGSAFSSVRAKRSDEHFAARMLADLGAVNAADELDALTDTLSAEVLLTHPVDLILVAVQGDEEAGMAYVSSLFSRRPWSEIAAVKEGRVVFLDRNLFHFKPNGRYLEAYSELYRVLCQLPHPAEDEA